VTRRSIAMLIALALVVGLGSAPASAITNGELDGNGHPYVGLMVAQDAKGNPLWRCSGTLLSATLYLTAGHCTEAPAARVEIWFDADVESGIPGNGYPFKGDVGGTPYTHPRYDPGAFYLYDLGVVVLDKPVRKKAYGKLPSLGQNTAYSNANPGESARYTAVGYGLQQINPAFREAERVRMYSTPHRVQIDGGIVGDFSILLSNNHSSGGTCFGDSGGPNFIGTSRVVGGVTSFGLNGTCGGTGGVYRLDTADDLDWLYGTFGAHLD
jgi:hypothetical protein